MKMLVKIMFALIAVFAMVSTAAPQETMKDSRDGKTYKTVKIGSQIWMAENLNYKTTNSYCLDNKHANCSKYGRLYTWSAAMDSVGKWSTNGKGCGYGETCSPTDPVRGVCPEGWHLPTELEFDILIDAVGGWKDAGVMLKSTTGWKDRNGTGDFGFSALPAGDGNGYGDFSSLGYGAYFWSSTEVYTDHASLMHLYDKFGRDEVSMDSDYKNSRLSVRCLRDRAVVAAPQETMKDSRDGKTYKTVKIGSQIWMAENLNHKTTNSYCHDDDPANCSKYGRHYEWNVALAACPNGWHLPTKAEFETLFDVVGGKKAASVMLKSTTGWKNDNGTDDFGFSALPAGSMSGPSHYSDKEGAYFWSSTDSYHAAYRMGLHRDDELGIGDERADLRAVGTDYGLSVRCVKD